MRTPLGVLPDLCPLSPVFQGGGNASQYQPEELEVFLVWTAVSRPDELGRPETWRDSPVSWALPPPPHTCTHTPGST